MGVFRLGRRYWTKQYYWDDLWAACTLIADVGLFLSIWLWPVYPGMCLVKWPVSIDSGHVILLVLHKSIEPKGAVPRIWIVGLLLPSVNW